MGQPTATITMTMREVDRVKTMQALADRMLRPAQAAARLGLTVRQVSRLAQRYLEDGPEGLVSRKRGRPSNHQLAVGVADRALAIVRERYADFGPTLAAEKLAELHGLKIGVETLRGLMTAAGLWIPRKQRAAKIHQPRNRRSCLGELIQIDGSDHAWFEDRAPACTLLVFIDDATSRLMQLHFVPTESSFAYFEATRSYLEAHGKPVAFYSDKASIFRPVTTLLAMRHLNLGLTTNSPQRPSCRGISLACCSRSRCTSVTSVLNPPPRAPPTRSQQGSWHVAGLANVFAPGCPWAFTTGSALPGEGLQSQPHLWIRIKFATLRGARDSAEIQTRELEPVSTGGRRAFALTIGESCRHRSGLRSNRSRSRRRPHVQLLRETTCADGGSRRNSR